jgi:hypothetical protein
MLPGREGDRRVRREDGLVGRVFGIGIVAWLGSRRDVDEPFFPPRQVPALIHKTFRELFSRDTNLGTTLEVVKSIAATVKASNYHADRGVWDSPFFFFFFFGTSCLPR